MTQQNNIKSSDKESYTKSSKKVPTFIWVVLGIIFMAGIGYATTINEQQISVPQTSTTNITDVKLIRSQNIGSEIVSYFTGTILNELRYRNLTNIPNNADIYTIRADVYNTNLSADPADNGFRNLVSRVNTYAPVDNANNYIVWNDYAGSTGAGEWIYVFENPCDNTYTDCSLNPTNNRTKYGLVVRFKNLQNGTGKEILRVENLDEVAHNLSVQYGIRLLGRMDTGISAGVAGASNYSNAFIDGNGQYMTDTRISNSKSISVQSSDTTTPVFLDLNGNIASNNAGLHILSDASGMGSRAALLWVRDAVATSTQPLTRIQNAGNGTAIYVLSTGNGTGIDLDLLGNRAPLIIRGNRTAITCAGTNAGAIYYDNSTFKHYGCNSTAWNALY